MRLFFAKGSMRRNCASRIHSPVGLCETASESPALFPTPNRASGHSKPRGTLFAPGGWGRTAIREMNSTCGNNILVAELPGNRTDQESTNPQNSPGLGMSLKVEPIRSTTTGFIPPSIGEFNIPSSHYYSWKPFRKYQASRTAPYFPL